MVHLTFLSTKEVLVPAVHENDHSKIETKLGHI